MAASPDLNALTPGARRIVETVQERRKSSEGEPGTLEWLLVLMERHGPMAEDLASDLAADALRRHLGREIAIGNLGHPLAAAAVVQGARARAANDARAEARERDVAAVILAYAGYQLRGAPTRPATMSAETAPLPIDPTSAPSTYTPRTKRPTPTLEQFGRDLTRDAVAGRLSALVGRDQEVDLVIETLCRRTKRNPALVGPAGVGKTAIVEGLAQRIVNGTVPELLRNVRVIALQPSNLIAGASLVGDKESRVKGVVEEASQDGIVLFIDEVHSVVGAGGLQGSTDIASLLKPSLARGDLACIGATTDDEYRRFIEPDAAMERRFQPIRIQELKPGQTLAILEKLTGEFTRTRGVTVEAGVLPWLLDFAARFLRNRHFPDKGVDLLEQCVAHAVATRKTVVDHSDATTVAERLIGRPLDAEANFETLRMALAERTLLTPGDALALVNRLAVTTRGLDVRPQRPNAVVILLGPAAHQRDALAEALAETLFGAVDRVVSLDFARFVSQWDVSALIGSPPGYVGYAESLPIHRLIQMPWCVLCCDNVHLSHPAARDILAQALDSGSITDGRGRRIYLSDAIVLITAGTGEGTAAHHVRGFRPWDSATETATTSSGHTQAETALGEGFVDLADLVCADVVSAESAGARWIEDHLMSDLAERFRRQGLSLRWDPSVVDWLLKRAGGSGHQAVERVIDEHVSALLVTHLPATFGAAPRAVMLQCEGDAIRVRPQP